MMEIYSILLSKRFFVAFMMFLSYANFQILRNSVNIAIVEMTSNKTFAQNNITMTQAAEFDWNSNVVGLVLSSGCYGGLFSMFGVSFVKWFGGSVSSSLWMLIGGILTLLHPSALYSDFRLFIACRFITGLCEALFYVSTIDTFARWYPKNERATLISFSFNGVNVGVAVVFPFCGYIAYTWGWQQVFYVTGAMSVFISTACLILVRNQPSQDKCISKKELAYIIKETDDMKTEVTNYPYKSILTSGPVWSLCYIQFAYIWISTVLGSCLPLFFSDSTHSNTYEIGLMCSIPNVVFFIAYSIAGVLMNYCIKHSTMSITRIHKILVIFSAVSSALSIVLMKVFSDFVISFILINLIQIFTTFMVMIVPVLAVNLHPESSSFVFGLILVFYSLGTIVSQVITTYIISDHSIQEWYDSFLLSAGVLLLSAIIFAIYGSSTLQPWGSSAKDEFDTDLELHTSPTSHNKTFRRLSAPYQHHLYCNAIRRLSAPVLSR